MRLRQRRDTLAEVRRQHLIAIRRSRPVVGADISDVEVEHGEVAIEFINADAAAADRRIEHLIVGHQQRSEVTLRLEESADDAQCVRGGDPASIKPLHSIVPGLRWRTLKRMFAHLARQFAIGRKNSHGSGNLDGIGIDDKSGAAILHQPRGLA